jgi:heterodisulfide reductase subunit B
MRQKDIEARSGERLNLPVLYFTQLLGLALGLKPGDLGLRSLMVDPMPMLTRKGIAAGRSPAAAVPATVSEQG